MSENTESATELVISADQPGHLEAVADFIEQMGAETLKLANRPYRTLMSTLRAIASDLLAEQEVAEMRGIVDTAAEVAYDNTDPDQLSSPELSWEDLSAEQKRSWRASALASLRAVGAIELTDEQADRILNSAAPVRTTDAADDQVPEDEAQARQAEDAEATETEVDPEPEVEPEVEESEQDEGASDTRAAVLAHTQPQAAPEVVAEPEGEPEVEPGVEPEPIAMAQAEPDPEPITPEATEALRQKALQAQQRFDSLGTSPAPVNPPYPTN